jgi:hypothetical protein
MSRRLPPRNYGYRIKTPFLYTMSYIMLILLSGYALGIKIPDAIDGIPTGLSMLTLRTADPVGKYIEPPHSNDLGGAPGATITGFASVGPSPDNLRISPEGAIETIFEKAQDQEMMIEDIQIVNSRTGYPCKSVLYPQHTAADEMSFPVSAQGCDTSPLTSGHGILRYNVTMEYGIIIGQVRVHDKAMGQISVWT